MERPLIMLVDDDEDIRNTFSSILEEEGYEVLGYRNGREALEALKSSAAPALILLDWMMPVMNGEEFIRKNFVQNISRYTPVVVVSAIADRIGKVPGVRAIVSKPLDIDVLLENVRRFSAPCDGMAAPHEQCS